MNFNGRAIWGVSGLQFPAVVAIVAGMQATARLHSFIVPGAVASRICAKLTALLGSPETSSGMVNGVWCCDAAWRFRRDDGSTWARLGMGPTRKMVQLVWNDRDATARLLVRHCLPY